MLQTTLPMIALSNEELQVLEPCSSTCDLYARLLATSERRGDCYHDLNQPRSKRPRIRCCGRKVGVRVYVVVFEHVYGSVPLGKGILHSCDDGRCWRPEHLRAGTSSENMEDRIERDPDSWAHGETHCRSSLSEAQVEEIRNRFDSGENRRRIARSIGVNRGTIYRIASYESRRRP